MKISTSASFVVASLALSASALALPTPESPTAAAAGSPQSRSVAQLAEAADGQVAHRRTLRELRFSYFRAVAYLFM